jgi:hypothetical protein
MSLPMSSNDPAYWMLESPECHSQPIVHSDNCYICTDHEFMLMGLPLCRECCVCKRNQRNKSNKLPVNPKNPQDIDPGYGHIPADDTMCSYCEHECSPDNPDCDYYEEGNS